MPESLRIRNRAVQVVKRHATALKPSSSHISVSHQQAPHLLAIYVLILYRQVLSRERFGLLRRDALQPSAPCFSSESQLSGGMMWNSLCSINVQYCAALLMGYRTGASGVPSLPTSHGGCVIFESAVSRSPFIADVKILGLVLASSSCQ
jgi:hypothetical protein